MVSTRSKGSLDIKESKTPKKLECTKSIPVKMYTPMEVKKSKRSLGLMSTGKKEIKFGKVQIPTPEKVVETKCAFLQHEIDCVYKVIRKQTGTLGGNGAGGAIYGEITQKSFQRIVDYLKVHCEFTKDSTFIDIGAGLGKPNFHTAIDPGVAISYGIELETLRWQLSLHNLKAVMVSDTQVHKQNKVIFAPGDIVQCTSFDPFTHVYSFDVGFPPDVMFHMANVFNTSAAQYVISFHKPKKMIETYNYNVHLLGRVYTSMAGSSEGHCCFIYQKQTENASKPRKQIDHIDPVFQPHLRILQEGNQNVLNWIQDIESENNQSSKRMRSQRQCKAKRKFPIQTSMMHFPKLKVARAA